jgi:hypothetical protein
MLLAANSQQQVANSQQLFLKVTDFIDSDQH